MGVDAVIPHKLQKALKFCNKKLADMRSEERRRVRMMFKLMYFNLYLAVWYSAMPGISDNEY